MGLFFFGIDALFFDQNVAFGVLVEPFCCGISNSFLLNSIYKTHCLPRVLSCSSHYRPLLPCSARCHVTIEGCLAFNPLFLAVLYVQMCRGGWQRWTAKQLLANCPSLSLVVTRQMPTLMALVPKGVYQKENMFTFRLRSRFTEVGCTPHTLPAFVSNALSYCRLLPAPP